MPPLRDRPTANRGARFRPRQVWAALSLVFLMAPPALPAQEAASRAELEQFRDSDALNVEIPLVGKEGFEPPTSSL